MWEFSSVFIRLLGLALLWTLMIPGVAMGQADAARLHKFERQLEQIRRETRITPNSDIPAGQRLLVDYGAAATFLFAAIDDRDQNTHILRQTEIAAVLRMELDNVHQFFLLVQSFYRDFNRGDSFDRHGDDWIEPQIERLHYRLDIGRLLAMRSETVTKLDLAVQVGRQLVQWGNGLVLSEDMDGGIFTLGYDQTTVKILIARMRNSATDFDSSRPNFDNDTDRDFYGAILTHQINAYHAAYIYGLSQQDHNDDPPRIDTPGGLTAFDYNSWYIGVGSKGTLSDRWRYGFELVYEGGDGLSADFPTVQTREDIDAWAMDLTLDYIFFDPKSTRIFFDLLLASGDSDRINSSDTVGGNRPGTDDNAFNAFGLLNTGFAFTPDASNLVMVKMGASSYPLRNVKMFRNMLVGGMVLIFNKLNRVGAIDEPSTSRRYLGSELDFYVNWQMTSDLSLAVRYGVFFPGQGLASDNDERHFVYVGTTLAF